MLIGDSIYAFQDLRQNCLCFIKGFEIKILKFRAFDRVVSFPTVQNCAFGKRLREIIFFENWVRNKSRKGPSMRLGFFGTFD